MLDLIIVGLVIALAGWGYQHGVITKAVAIAGFGAGALIGWWVAPRVLRAVLPDPYGPMLAVPAALMCGVLLAAALDRLGYGLRRRLRGRDKLEAAGGALLAALIGLLAIWTVVGVVARVDALSDAVGDSAVIGGLNAVVPAPGPLVDPETSDPLRGPPGSGRARSTRSVNVTRDPDVRAAKTSVVKIGVLACGSGRQGSGWIAADGIVVTNAHVVAQSEAISLQLGGEGESHAAEAIWYDEENDIAILRSPGMSGERALAINPKPRRGAPLAMLGFPDGGPYTVKPARLGVSARIPGFRLEGGRYVTARVARLIAGARPGNSGGPLVGPDGRAVGVVFASGGYTAYAVLASTVQRALRRVEGPVSTGACQERG